MTPVLLATLGGKAQIVTFALDYLLQQKVAIAEVIVLHLAPPDPTQRRHRALLHLQGEFQGGRYQGRPCRLHQVALRDRDGRRLLDMTSDESTEAAWHAIRQVVVELQQQERSIHLCLSGGRRLLSLLSLSVAALHFTANDHIWHLYTPDDLRQAAGEGAILHAPAEGPQPYLLEVPIMPGSEVLPGLRALLAASPGEVLAHRRTRLAADDQVRCQQVWASLKARPREVLVRLARGASPQDVAEQLNIALTTVSSHQNAIYDACRIAWALEEEAIDYRWLQQRFGAWPGLPD